MPTGYTSDLYDGKPTSFRAFVLRCARGMGALVTMREDPMDAPIPDSFEPSNHHAEKEQTARARIVALMQMTDEEMKSSAREEHLKNLAQWESSSHEAKERVGRYQEMLHQVSHWTPPTPDHQEFKTFMIEQLEISIKHDGWVSSEPKEATPEDWKNAAITQAGKDISYHAIEWQKEKQRADERTQWVRQLKGSLPVPEGEAKDSG